jgi:hypothetical protein
MKRGRGSTSRRRDGTSRHGPEASARNSLTLQYASALILSRKRRAACDRGSSIFLQPGKPYSPRGVSDDESEAVGVCFPVYLHRRRPRSATSSPARDSGKVPTSSRSPRATAVPAPACEASTRLCGRSARGSRPASASFSPAIRSPSSTLRTLPRSGRGASRNRRAPPLLCLSSLRATSSRLTRRGHRRPRGRCPRPPTRA